MLENLPKKIRSEWELIQNTTIPGAILRCLCPLLHALRYSKQTSTHLIQLDKQLEDRDRKKRKNCDKAIQWMKECLSHLKKSPFANHPLVVPHLQKVEKLLCHRHYDESNTGIVSRVLTRIMLGTNNDRYNPLDEIWGFKDAALEALGKATDIIASFGLDPLFDGWAKIESRLITLEDKAKNSLLEKNLNQPISHQLRWKLAEMVGHGVHSLEIQEIYDPLDSKKQLQLEPFIYVRTGFLDKFIFPIEVADIFDSQNGLGKRKFVELLDSDPATLYRLLRLLSQYEAYEPATFPPKKALESWNDVEDFIKQADIGYYLSCFGSNDSTKHPYTKQQLTLLIKQFLIMILGFEANKELIKGGELKSQLSGEAKEFCIQEIKKLVEQQDEKEREIFTKIKAFDELQRIAIDQGKDPAFVNAISWHLVERKVLPQARRELSEKGIKWKPKGGRPIKAAKKRKTHGTKKSH